MAEIASRKKARAQGLERYYTGKPCKHGRYAERSVRSGMCAECQRLRGLRRYHEDPEHSRWQARKWRAENPERVRAKGRKHYLANREYYKKAVRDWRRRNSEHHVEYNKRRYHLSAKAKTERYCCRAFKRTLYAAAQGKGGKTQDILGYSPHELRQHLEKQFAKGMTWENYGAAWHIDHVTPIAVLVESGVKDPAKINALPNLQPVWKEYNLSKGSEVRQLI